MDRAERTAAARDVLLRVSSELEAAVGSFEPGSVDRFVVITPTGTSPSSELRFATGDGTVLAYRVEGASRLVRAAGSRFAPPPAPEPLPLLGGVMRFRVRCFDGVEWRAAWTRPGVPRAVQVALVVDDGAGGSEEFGTTVVLPASDS